MGGVFISYRREDSAGFAGRLADALAGEFGQDRVFRDVDDIQPGEDFVAAIRRHLDGVDAVLVVIGPSWLSAAANGGRRLDDPGDFVRREVETALASGKPVIPVLVGGAAMPGETALPTALAGLARRQAMHLDDPGWRDGIGRLIAALRPLLRRHRAGARRRVWLGAAAALGVLALAWALRAGHDSPQEAVPIGIEGRWQARVTYAWGAEHSEEFDFQVNAGEVSGTAGYLRLARGILAGRLEDRRLSFVTHSEEILGDAPPRRVTHRYVGEVRGDEIHFVLQSDGGYSSHAPVRFIARRAVPR